MCVCVFVCVCVLICNNICVVKAEKAKEYLFILHIKGIAKIYQYLPIVCECVLVFLCSDIFQKPAFHGNF